MQLQWKLSLMDQNFCLCNGKPLYYSGTLDTTLGPNFLLVIEVFLFERQKCDEVDLLGPKLLVLSSKLSLILGVLQERIHCT